MINFGSITQRPTLFGSSSEDDADKELGPKTDYQSGSDSMQKYLERINLDIGHGLLNMANKDTYRKLTEIPRESK